MGGVAPRAIITSDVQENNVAVPINGVAVFKAPAPHIAPVVVSVEIMGCTMEKGKWFRLRKPPNPPRTEPLRKGHQYPYRPPLKLTNGDMAVNGL